MRYYALLLLMMVGLSASGTQKVGDHVVRIGGFAKESPYMFVNANGKPSGFAVELTDSIMRSLNMPYEIVMYDRRNVSIEQILDSCDVMMACAITPENRKSYFLTSPHTKISYDLVFCNTTEYSSNRDLADKKIIVIGNSVVYQKLLEFKKGFFDEIIVVSNMMDGLKMLAEGKGDYAVCNSAYSRELISRNNLDNLTIVQSALQPFDLGFAAKDQALIVGIDSMLSELKERGSYKALYYKWYGRDLSNQ